MNRFMTVAMLILTVGTLTVPTATATGRGGGNVDGAHACQQGGYLDLVRSDADGGGGFATVGECVRYAAQGGELTGPAGENTPCSDGNWERLAPASNPSLSFGSNEACLDYIANVGQPVAYDPAAPQVLLFDLGSGSFGLCAVGVGLKRFPANTHVAVSITTGGGGVAGSPFTVTTDGNGATNPTTVLVSVASGTYTASATAGGHTYSHTVRIPIPGSSC